MHIQKLLIITGIVLLIAGLFWPHIMKIGLGKLPGDFVFGDKNFKLYLPVTTCLIFSVVLSVILWIFKK